MKQLQEGMEQFIQVIHNTEVYITFQREKERVAKHPMLKEQIDAYRRESFELQNRFEGEELLREMDQFEKRHEEVLANPLLFEYLEAEVALCRMFQDIMREITDGIEFD